MRDEAKTFLDVSPALAKVKDLLADHALTSLPAEERIKVLAEALHKAAHAHNDEATLELLKLLGRAYDRRDKEFTAYLRNLYWELPDKRRTGECYSRTEEKYLPTYGATLLQTKLYILSRLIWCWEEKLTPESIDAFRFLIATYSPQPKIDQWSKQEIPRREWESDVEFRARGRQVFKEEKEGILKLIRDRVERFSPESFEQWLKQTQVPGEIQHILVVARARNGGIKLAERDIRYAELLKPLEPDKRSAAALELYQQLSAEIAALDNAVVTLYQQMHPDRGYFGSDEIGKSEYVRGEIAVTYPSLKEVNLTVTLYKDCSDGLGRDIFGRARRHIEKWHEGYRTLTINLSVVGGEANLNLAHQWRA